MTDRLLQHLSRLAQGYVVAKRLVPADFGGLDVAGENAQRRQGLVGRIFRGKAIASLQSGRRVAPLERMHSVVSQHHLAAVFEDVELHPDHPCIKVTPPWLAKGVREGSDTG
ncbi:hypothetical protein [Variovorax sp. SRS16]|uniref:hypothetical protein n=1 Tax=Variovorax sp. SRS16 TaxID=282217 RepID=UPI0013A5919F|nr:hypothetical protein [Variovorax sp. SRS16]